MSWINKKEKREAREKLIADAGAILKAAVAEKRTMTTEEEQKFDAMHKDADKVLAEIETLDRQIEAERSIEKRIGREEYTPSDEPDNKDLERRAFRAWLKGGPAELTPEERVAFHKYTTEQRAVSGLSATTAGAGAEFVPQSFSDQFFAKLKAWGGVREAGPTVISDSTGAPLPVPTLNDTGNTGELLGENTAATDDDSNDPDTSNITLHGYTFSSKVVRCPVQLLQDSAFPVDQWLGDALVERVGRRQNYYYTKGSGTGEPTGCVTASTLGTTAAATAAVTYHELLEIKHSVDPAYRNQSKFMFNDTTLLLLKKLVDGNDKPLWNAGNIALGIPPTIDGDPYIINQDMDSPAAAKKIILYGLFSRMVLRDVGSIQLVRFGEKYMNQLQVGFLAWVRGDAGCVDTSAIKHLITHA